MTELHVLEHVDSDIGTIYLCRRRVSEDVGAREVHEIYIDGLLLMSDSKPVSEERLSTAALEQHDGQSLRVLVGGLGLGHTARAALQSTRVASVRVVEKLGAVNEWMKAGKLPLSPVFADDPRLELAEGDVYEDLLGPASETYDLILVDVDHSTRDRLSEASAPFYSAAGQAQAARHLRPGGLLVVWSAEDDDDFLAVLSSVYPHAQREHVQWVDANLSEFPLQNVLFFGHASSASDRARSHPR